MLTGLSKPPSRERKSLDNYIYIVKCADGTLYTGWTNDLKKRLAAHNSGKGAKYTKHRFPVELVYCEKWATKELAMQREYEIKLLSRHGKLKLAENSGITDEFLNTFKR